MSTKIGWTNETINPFPGCTKVSEGCKNCYAEKMAFRVHNMAWARGNTDLFNAYDPIISGTGKWTGETSFVESALEKPLHWKKPRMIFVNSMGDTFHESVPFEWIDKVMSVIALCPQHTFQILTKRPERMLEYCTTPVKDKISDMLPLSNAWLGVTAENQKCADKRIPILLQIPAAKRFVSIEPMLEEVNIFNHKSTYDIYLSMRLDWIICGCESGHNRRPCKLEWVESIVEQCRDVSVPVFVKQLQINGKVEHDMTKFPKHLQIQEWPK